MKRFVKTYMACLFLMGLLLVLCMGWPVGMVLLVIFEEHPSLFWMLTALVPAILSSVWLAWQARLSVLGAFQEFMKDKKNP